MASYKEQTAPSIEPITLDEAKVHLGVTISEHDAMIGSLITSARQRYEAETGLQLINATWKMYLDKFINPIKIFRCPVASITSIAYTDTDGNSQTLTEGTDFEVDLISYPARIVPYYGTSFPSVCDGVNKVIITFASGFGATAATVNKVHKQAILMILAHYYENREDVIVGRIATALPQASQRIIALEKYFEYI